MKRVLTIAGAVWLGELRRKDVYVVLVLMPAFLVVLASVDVLGMGGIAGYVKEAGLLLAWLFAWIISVNISSRLLPEEESRRTVFSLLARPVTRAQVVLGKWLGSWTIASAATLLFYAALLGVVMLRDSAFIWIVLAQAISLHICMLAMLCALGTAFSSRLNRDAAATMTYAISLGSILILPRVPNLVMHATGLRQTGLMILYHAFPRFDLFDMRRRLVHDWGPVSAGTFVTVFAYGTVVTMALLLLGWIAYRRRRFSRGALQ